jgi:hypothetical protein
MAERRGYRPETREATLPAHIQRQRWHDWAQHAEQQLGSIDNIDQLVDFIRTANLRAANAGRLGDRVWTDKLYDIKYRLLIKAAQMRKEGVDIQIGTKDVFSPNSERQQSIFFVFNTDPKPFVTETLFKNLNTIMTADELGKLFEPYDELDPAIQRRQDWTLRVNKPQE